MAWFLWIKQARPNAFHVPDYHPPLATFAAGIAAIVVLVSFGYWLRTLRAEPASRRAPRVSRIVLTTMALIFPWYILMALLFIPRQFRHGRQSSPV